LRFQLLFRLALSRLSGDPYPGREFLQPGPAPLRDYIAKIGLFPASPELMALTDAPLDLNHDPDALRHAVKAFFATKGGA
jgi:hypothetical protein